jgi:hypothetical protein
LVRIRLYRGSISRQTLDYALPACITSVPPIFQFLAIDHSASSIQTRDSDTSFPACRTLHPHHPFIISLRSLRAASNTSSARKRSRMSALSASKFTTAMISRFRSPTYLDATTSSVGPALHSGSVTTTLVPYVVRNCTSVRILRGLLEFTLYKNSA